MLRRSSGLGSFKRRNKSRGRGDGKYNYDESTVPSEVPHV